MRLAQPLLLLPASGEKEQSDRVMMLLHRNVV